MVHTQSVRTHNFEVYIHLTGLATMFMPLYEAFKAYLHYVLKS